jgi:CheY-like chemotaxis protein
VWVVRPAEATELASIGDEALSLRIERRMDSMLGRVTVEPGRQVHPLVSLLPDRFAANRVALVGEAGHVWADPIQLENAILNLCVNARDAMEGTGDLTIAVETVALGRGQIDELPPGDYVRVSVTDTGSGIPPEHLDRVFEPFFTTKAVGKGTGLGLSQVFGFARQSGGDVTIDSTLGEGTTVTIYLPCARNAERMAQRAEAETDQESQPTERFEGATILVVEDDPRVARATVGALEELGYRTIACSGGEEALQVLASEQDIALVVTDVMMPEMTGTELARVIRRDYPNIAVLFVTGYVGEAGEAEDLSEHALLRKPFTVSALSVAVASALSGNVSGSRHASATAAAG